jgi:hypothetical protein
MPGSRTPALDKIEAQAQAAEKDATRTSHAENVGKDEEKAEAKKEDASSGTAVHNPVV